MTIDHKIRDSHKEKILKWIYDRLYLAFGPRKWWPADTPFEVIVGAILTQNTAWSNVERAIKNLKETSCLTPRGLRLIDTSRLAQLIRPSGYYNQKAQKLKEFIGFLFARYRGSLDLMFKTDPLILRQELLGIKGIGPETADSILLYAGNFPIFVVDAYTRRLLSCHNLIDQQANYSSIQSYFMDNLPRDVKLFNEFHALIVQLGKEICRPKPNCAICPLRELDEIVS